MPVPGSESFECAASFWSPQPVSPMTHKEENQALPTPYSCLLSLLIQENDHITFLCKGITPEPHVLLFFY